MQGENLAALFADFGVEAVAGGMSATVLLDEHDEDVLHGAAQSTNYAMTYARADFPDLRHGDSIVIDGDNYQVHTINKLPPDGALCKAMLFTP